mgnify:FL=1
MKETRKVVVDGEEFEVIRVQNGENWIAQVDNKTFEISIPESGPIQKQKRKASGKSKKSGKVSAHIPGKVVTVEVGLGDLVSEGDVIMILEAMKMQNEIQAPISGVVSEIHCEEGQSIEANVPLVVIEPEDTEN